MVNPTADVLTKVSTEGKYLSILLRLTRLVTAANPKPSLSSRPAIHRILLPRPPNGTVIARLLLRALHIVKRREDRADDRLQRERDPGSSGATDVVREADASCSL